MDVRIRCLLDRINQDVTQMTQYKESANMLASGGRLLPLRRIDGILVGISLVVVGTRSLSDVSLMGVRLLNRINQGVIYK